MKPTVILSLLFLLAACGREAATPHKHSSALSSGNTMNCVAGDLRLTGSGEPEVGIASFGIQGDIITGFGLSLNVDRGDKVYELSSSLMPMPIQSGTYHFPALTEPGMSRASYKIRSRDHDLLRDYNGGIYSQQFSPLENDPEAKLKIEVTRMIVSDAPLPGFKRIHAVGQFEFNAAALPASEPSDACVRDGVARSIKGAGSGKRILPLFDAEVCGAEKTHVHCNFDVVIDLAKLQ